ncbi:MAG: TRAP transporter small permease subunit [Flaviflexus sp.]|uniref:TRAP transporter small permease n=1 Tax=Flaviflexus ciconiae TaxID=2496867 RepID=A0A3S9PV19_9ACTO|nr:TRAP transporter small permease [Flaviflexus ciconiae]AZQ76162.1 TRAP transporter small permease [Flaviflexus ciconiae]
MRTIPRPLVLLAETLVIVAGALLVFLMLLTVADVGGRAFADSSILGTVEISTLLMVAIAFLGLAAAEIHNRHVSVELVEAYLPPVVRLILAGVRTVLITLTGIVISWGLLGVLTSAFERGETTSGILRLATWPMKGILLVSFVLFFVVAIWNAINEFLDMKEGKVVEDDQLLAVQQAIDDADDITDTVVAHRTEEKK